jgi:hypothetical protein
VVSSSTAAVEPMSTRRDSQPAYGQWLTMAYVCGIFPLVAGMGIFLTWCVTGNRFLEMLGLFTIMGGCFAFLVGIVSLGYYLIVSINDRHAGRCLALGFLALVILVVNFPVCFVIVQTVAKMQRGNRASGLLELSTVHIINASGSGVREIEIVGVRNAPGVLADGQSIMLDIEQPTASELTFRAKSEGKPVELKFSLPRRGREGWGTTAMVVLLPNGQVKAYRPTLPWYRDDSD